MKFQLSLQHIQAVWFISVTCVLILLIHGFESSRRTQSSCLLLYSLNVHGGLEPARPELEAWNSMLSPTGVIGPQWLGLSPVPAKVSFGRKLESESRAWNRMQGIPGVISTVLQVLWSIWRQEGKVTWAGEETQSMKCTKVERESLN